MENNNVTDYSSAFNYLDGVANKYQDSANKLALASLATGLGVSSMGEGHSVQQQLEQDQHHQH